MPRRLTRVVKIGFAILTVYWVPPRGVLVFTPFAAPALLVLPAGLSSFGLFAVLSVFALPAGFLSFNAADLELGFSSLGVLSPEFFSTA